MADTQGSVARDALADDPIRTAIHADRRTRRSEFPRRERQDARARLRASLSSAPNIRHLLEFVGLLCRVAEEMEAAGVTGDLPATKAHHQVGRELLGLARLGDRRELARVAYRRMFEFYEPLEEDYRYYAPPETIARWKRGGVRQAHELVMKYLEKPDISHNRSNWQHVEGLHYLRVEFWYELGALAGFEEEDGMILDPREPLTTDDPGLLFPALCAMTADDLREFLTKRSRDCVARVPLRVRRNINRVRKGSEGNAAINQTPVDLFAKSSNEVCLRLIEELDRMARITGWDGSPPPSPIATPTTPPPASVNAPPTQTTAVEAPEQVAASHRPTSPQAAQFFDEMLEDFGDAPTAQMRDLKAAATRSLGMRSLAHSESSIGRALAAAGVLSANGLYPLGPALRAIAEHLSKKPGRRQSKSVQVRPAPSKPV